MPQVTWAKDGKPLKPDDRTKISFKDGVAKTTIKKVTVQDAAQYSIIAKNAGGELQAAFSVIVEKKKDKKKEKKEEVCPLSMYTQIIIP